MKKLRAGSRESRLAVVQTELVMAAIREREAACEIELVTMKTTGDKILDRTLDKVGGKGLFVKELDAALLDGRVDFTVHSCKDLPMDLDPRLPLAGFSRRADPRDALVLPVGASELDRSKPIGCASARRALQLKRLFPGQPVAPVRGNVLTRLAKLDGGQYAALVLAVSGLERLGLEGRISRVFSTDEMLPAAGQGILAVQIRAGEDAGYLSAFLDREAADCALAERAFVRRLDGGCSSPVAAFATVEGESLTLRGMDVTAAGEPIFDTITGPRDQGEALGIALADRIREGTACTAR
ncbi:MAG TPA: hydroxymethylbilane synthase [Candidatus Intestinimonas stercorigallinarum]|nr:hydroxymethylbilane synthase [Candidatus Intestinimonas stercorigallinarum]